MLAGEVRDVVVGLLLEKAVVCSFDAVLVANQSLVLSFPLLDLFRVQVEVLRVGLVVFHHFFSIGKDRFLK